MSDYFPPFPHIWLLTCSRWNTWLHDGAWIAIHYIRLLINQELILLSTRMQQHARSTLPQTTNHLRTQADLDAYAEIVIPQANTMNFHLMQAAKEVVSLGISSESAYKRPMANFNHLLSFRNGSNDHSVGFMSARAPLLKPAKKRGRVPNSELVNQSVLPEKIQLKSHDVARFVRRMAWPLLTIVWVAVALSRRKRIFQLATTRHRATPNIINNRLHQMLSRETACITIDSDYHKIVLWIVRLRDPNTSTHY